MTGLAHNMKRINLKDAKANFGQVFEDVLLRGELVQIMKDTGNAILASAEVWRGMTEKLSLLSIPGLRESIRSFMRGNIADTATELDW
jgi:PHD/YefM family antitoxin component YafN of YafNO toxin-antitoxin module